MAAIDELLNNNFEDATIDTAFTNDFNQDSQSFPLFVDGWTDDGLGYVILTWLRTSHFVLMRG
jgi:hypothetical protein